MISAASALAVVFTSCESSKFEGYTKEENGLYAQFFNKSENGQKPQIGDVVMLRYKFMLQKNDSVFMDSKDASRDGSGFAEIGIQRSTFVGSLEDGILLMTKGDSAAFIVPADSFFLKTMGMNELPKFVNKGDYMKAVIKMGDIRTKQQVEEQQKKMMQQQEEQMKVMEAAEKPAIEKYLADNKITAKPTASGLIYVELKAGKGKKAKPNDIVKVKYVGRLLDGTLFDTSEEAVAKADGVYQEGRPYQPYTFPLAQTPQQVISGWEEALLNMSVGTKAKIIVPSALGYGARGNGPIPPFAPITFEMELVDISPMSQQPAQQQVQPAR